MFSFIRLALVIVSLHSNRNPNYDTWLKLVLTNKNSTHFISHRDVLSHLEDCEETSPCFSDRHRVVLLLTTLVSGLDPQKHQYELSHTGLITQEVESRRKQQLVVHSSEET